MPGGVRVCQCANVISATNTRTRAPACGIVSDVSTGRRESRPRVERLLKQVRPNLGHRIPLAKCSRKRHSAHGPIASEFMQYRRASTRAIRLRPVLLCARFNSLKTLQLRTSGEKGSACREKQKRKKKSDSLKRCTKHFSNPCYASPSPLQKEFGPVGKFSAICVLICCSITHFVVQTIWKKVAINKFFQLFSNTFGSRPIRRALRGF